MYKHDIDTLKKFSYKSKYVHIMISGRKTALLFLR